MFPLAHTVTHRATTYDGTDEYGNPVPSTTDTEVQVYGWAPVSMAEPPEAGRSEVAWEAEIYSPEAAWSPRPSDRVLLDGVEFEVVGYPENWNKGPFGWQPGIVVHVKRVEG